MPGSVQGLQISVSGVPGLEAELNRRFPRRFATVGMVVHFYLDH
jgi:hypothetical protein